MPIYLGDSASSGSITNLSALKTSRIQSGTGGWVEYNTTSSIADGAESDAITLASTGGFYGHYFLMWSWDGRTSYPWYDAVSGDGYGYGILQGTHASQNYVYRDIYSNESSVSSLTSNSFKITNSTGDASFLVCRVQAWSFTDSHQDPRKF